MEINRRDRSTYIHQNIGCVLTKETPRTVSMVIGSGGAGQRFHVRRSLLLVRRLIIAKSVFFSGSVLVLAAVHLGRTVSTLRMLEKLRQNVEPARIAWF